jgi:Txe/YoeB family toxin of Txe-Axe toxin-antitoxin module
MNLNENLFLEEINAFIQSDIKNDNFKIPPKFEKLKGKIF